MHLCPFSVCREIPATFSNPRYFFSCPSTHLAFSLPASVTFRDAVSILPIALSSWRLHQCRRPLAYWISSGVISIGGPLTCVRISRSLYFETAQDEPSSERTPKPRPFIDTTLTRRRRITSPLSTSGSDVRWGRKIWATRTWVGAVDGSVRHKVSMKSRGPCFGRCGGGGDCVITARISVILSIEFLLSILSDRKSGKFVRRLLTSCIFRVLTSSSSGTVAVEPAMEGDLSEANDRFGDSSCR